jgi:hypothetical protein
MVGYYHIINIIFISVVADKIIIEPLAVSTHIDPLNYIYIIIIAQNSIHR